MRRALLLFFSVGFSVACGSRGPLDITGNYGVDAGSELDASVQDTGIADTGADVAPESGADAGPVVNCAQCVAQKCGQQFLQCFQNTDCRTTLQCAVQNCFKNGGFDQTCLLQKCGMDLKGFAELLGVVACVASNCGQDCIGVLGMGS